MSSYRQHLYHLVIRTKGGLPTINLDNADQLYAYISGIIKNKDSHLYRINGIENHIHILTDKHPSFAPADFMRELKVSTSIWMKNSGLFPKFHGWSEGYGSFTCSYKDIDRIIEYIKTQQEHHKKLTFEEEYRLLIQEAGINIDEKFFHDDSAPVRAEKTYSFLPPVSPGVIHIWLFQSLLHSLL